MNLSGVQTIITDLADLKSSYLFNRDLCGAYYSPGTIFITLQILTQLTS